MGFWIIDKLSRPVIIIIVIFLALCLIAGGIVAFFIPDILRDMVLKQLPIRDPTSTAFDSWQNPTNHRNPKDRQTVIMNYYLWNITNPVEFMAGQKPRIQQIGPYVHTQNRWKQAPGGGTIPDNCYWTDDETLVHFKYHKVYYYDSERTNSKWSLNDTVYTLNVPLMALLPTVLPLASKLGISQDTVVALLKSYEVVTKKTVQQALWGYTDSLLELVAKLQPGRSSTFSLATNDTLEYYSRESVQYTGHKNIDKFINYKEWAGYKALPWWASDSANFIQGTDGSMFPPVPIRKKNKVWVFIDELGRSMEVEYQKEVTYKGVTLYRYSLGPEALRTASEVPANKDFYNFGPSGLFNLTSMKGAPIFIGKPQFLDGAQEYRDALVTNVDGYDSSRDALDTTISVEPYTGATFMFDKRLQVNYKVERFSWLPAAANLTNVMLPVYWAEEQMQLSQKRVDDWNHKIGNLLKAARVFSFIGVILGPIQLLFGIALLVNYCRIRKEHSKEYFVESPAIVDPQDNSQHFPMGTPQSSPHVHY